MFKPVYNPVHNQFISCALNTDLYYSSTQPGLLKNSIINTVHIFNPVLSTQINTFKQAVERLFKLLSAYFYTFSTPPITTTKYIKELKRSSL